MGALPQFRGRVDPLDGLVRVALEGELDITTVPLFEDCLALAGEGGSVVLDLQGLTFLDSSALHAFVAAQVQAGNRGHRLTIVGASPRARQLFELTGTEFLLNDA